MCRGGDDERRRDHEEIVRRRIDPVAAVDDTGGFLRQARQQRIDGAEQQIGAVAARYAGEGGREPGYRVAAGAQKDDAAEWHQQHVADLAGGIRQHARQHDDEREQPCRGREHQQSQCGGDQAARFHDADPQHRNEHGAERGEPGEVHHHLGQDAVEAVDGQQVGGPHGRARARVHHFEVHRGRHGGRQDGKQRQNRKDGGRVRQGVADALDSAQKDGGPIAQARQPLRH